MIKFSSRTKHSFPLQVYSGSVFARLRRQLHDVPDSRRQDDVDDLFRRSLRRRSALQRRLGTLETLASLLRRRRSLRQSRNALGERDRRRRSVTFLRHSVTANFQQRSHDAASHNKRRQRPDHQWAQFGRRSALPSRVCWRDCRLRVAEFGIGK